MKTISAQNKALSHGRNVFSLAAFLLCTVAVNAQTTYSNEKFPNLFNAAEAAPVNTTFNGSIGTWQAYSSDVNSTISAKTEVSSTDLKFTVKANALAATSVSRATSPDVDLSTITCTSKFDFFFDIYGANITTGMTGVTIRLQLFDGTNWNEVWSKTASQLNDDYGANTWGTVGMMISTIYMGMPNFKYRFITENAAGNTSACAIYIDNVKVVNYSCGATAAVGNRVWNDANINGVQDAGENGIAGITVKLAVAPGDTLTSVTDGNGEYLFTSLAPAGYKLIFPLIAGMSVTTANVGNDEFDSDISIANRSVSFFLSDGEINSTIDAGFNAMSVLSVKLVSFQGILNSRGAELNWRVAANESADRFVIEKSSNGNEFTEAGMVFSTTDNGAKSYSFNDATSFSGKVYYRLKSFDKLGVIEYSKIIMLTNAVISQDVIKIVGNPVTDKVNLSYTSVSNTPSVLRIYDMSGRVQFSQTVNSREGMNAVSITLPAALANGIYVAELTSGTSKSTAKFVKQY